MARSPSIEDVPRRAAAAPHSIYLTDRPGPFRNASARSGQFSRNEPVALKESRQNCGTCPLTPTLRASKTQAHKGFIPLQARSRFLWQGAVDQKLTDAHGPPFRLLTRRGGYTGTGYCGPTQAVDLLVVRSVLAIACRRLCCLPLKHASSMGRRVSSIRLGRDA